MSAVTRRVLERAGARHAFDGSTARGAGSRTKSISPDTSAASLVASLAIGVSTTSWTLPSNLPHQAGLRL